MNLFKNLFIIALKNVWLHRKHSLAAIISIAAGFISFSIFQGYMRDLDLLYLETFRSRFMYGDVLIENTAATSPEGKSHPEKHWIPTTDQKFIQDFLDQKKNLVTDTSRFLFVSGMAVHQTGSTIFRGLAYDLESGTKIRGPEWQWNSVYGVPLHQATTTDSVLVGQYLGSFIGCQPEKKYQILNSSAGYKPEIHPFHCQSPTVQLQTLTVGGQMNALDLEVVGLIDAVYKEVDDKYVSMSLKTGQQLLNTDLVSYYTAKVSDSSSIPGLIKDFNEHAKRHQKPYHMQRWQDHDTGDLYRRTMDLLGVFRNFVVIIIISISGLSVFNVMMKVVKERTREIGTLQSLGFDSWQIKFIFLTEAVLLSLAGALVGGVISLISTWITNSLGIAYRAGVLSEPVPFQVVAAPDLYLTATAILSAIAILTAFVAIQSTMKNKISDNLTFN